LPAEYVAGWQVLQRKIRRYRPETVALVGITLWRAVLPLLDVDDDQRAKLRRRACPGPQPVTVHGARVHVLPNPSGRNANFSYAEMLEAFRELRVNR
jgi:TDG/mug DNA glycosylase family protein